MTFQRELKISIFQLAQHLVESEMKNAHFYDGQKANCELEQHDLYSATYRAV